MLQCQRFVTQASALARQVLVAPQAPLAVLPILTAAKLFIIVYKLKALLSRASRNIKAFAKCAIAVLIIIQLIARLQTSAASDKALQYFLVAVIAVSQLINA
jgi:hypothetical protein